jgi:putative ABC transport system permease protein
MAIGHFFVEPFVEAKGEDRKDWQVRLDDLLRISFRQVLRQWRRNLGVVVAIGLGTAGLVVVITMGHNVKENVNQNLELLGGATRIELYFEKVPEKYAFRRPQWFRESTIAVLRRLPGVEAVSLLRSVGGRTIFTEQGRRIRARDMKAVDQFFWKVNSYSPAAGSLFAAKEVVGRQTVCVLGSELARKIFKREEPLGRLLYIGKDYYRVVGVLEQVGTGTRNNTIYIPLTTAEDRIPGFWEADRLLMRCQTWEKVKEISANVSSVVRAHQPDDLLQVQVAWANLERVQWIAWLVETFVMLAVFATLLLGGFGIWNIMMAAVTARTREIGLKKAMGAEDGDILAQFLTEALCLSVVPAMIGIVVGRIAMEVLGSFLGIQPDENLFMLCVAMGLLFALILGVGGGFVPSLRASRMEVVSAMRFE